MQKKLYLGGLPWELDRIGLVNYFKAVLEGAGIKASYELPFITAPVDEPEATVRVVDTFVAMDRQTRKSRGFGFITVEFADEASADTMFPQIIELINNNIVIGIRGPRELIVNEATPRDDEGAPARSNDNAVSQEEPAPAADSSSESMEDEIF